MELRLHKNAKTTPATRAYIQKSSKSVAALAAELGLSEVTVRRWRSRQTVEDRSSRPHALKTSMTPTEEALAVELRKQLWLSLDDALEVLRRVKPDLSRAALYRCWGRHDVANRPKQDRAASRPFQTDRPAGFIHVDIKHLTKLGGKRSYAFVAIDRATRFVYVEILNDRKALTAAGFLERFLAAFPLRVHTILSDNGSEFTDRFAVDKKDKPEDRPSGDHPFDKVCTDHGIDHRLTKPFCPQTNGMVERFNRRLQDHLNTAPKNGRNQGKNCFDSHKERNTYICDFVEAYNRTRLRCLSYKAPIEILNNLTEHNTKAGI